MREQSWRQQKEFLAHLPLVGWRDHSRARRFPHQISLTGHMGKLTLALALAEQPLEMKLGGPITTVGSSPALKPTKPMPCIPDRRHLETFSGAYGLLWGRGSPWAHGLLCRKERPFGGSGSWGIRRASTSGPHVLSTLGISLGTAVRCDYFLF